MKFGTDGIRGRAGYEPITAESAVKVGRAAAKLGGRVLVARDPRPSGEMLAAAVAAGIAAEGSEAVLVGVLPTPGLALALHAGLGDAGVMLTASHNPASDNGFKVFGRGGHKLSSPEQAEFEGWLAMAAGEGPPGRVRFDREGALETYVGLVEHAVDMRALAGSKIALDLANGASIALIPWLIEQPVEWVLVGDGAGEVNDAVGSEHLEALCRVVVDSGCDAGLAVDGDGDRCRIVDRMGRVLPGDAVAAWLARGRGATGLAVTVMSTGSLETSLPEVRIVRTAVGDRHLREAMEAHDLELGAEESGHILFSDLVAGDGLISGLRALALGDASEALEALPMLPRTQLKVPVARRPPLDELPVLAAFERRSRAVLGEHGRVFLRYSGTEPVLRILVEGDDAVTVQAVAEDAAALARELLG